MSANFAAISVRLQGRSEAGLARKINSPTPAIPPLGDASKTLLVEASLDRAGTILRIASSLGMTVQTNNKNFTPERDARNQARWESAIEELEKYGLIQDRNYKRELYNVTDEGFRVADALRAPE